MVIENVVHLYRTKRSKTNMKRDMCNLDSHILDLL